eukprot:149001_1
MLHQLSTSILMMLMINLVFSNILTSYIQLDQEIKDGMIQTVIDNDSVAFDAIVAHLGFDVTASTLLFDFIERTASPKLGPGLAFGQFERREEYIQTAEIQKVPLQFLVNAKNVELSHHGGIKFVYPGMYRVSVQFRGGVTTSEGHCHHTARLIGLNSAKEVGRSVTVTTGGYASYGGINLSFFANIIDKTDTFILEFLRDEADKQGMRLDYPGSVHADVDADMVTANIVVLVENIGQAQ